VLCLPTTAAMCNSEMM